MTPPDAKDIADCEHKDFSAEVDVNRLTDSGRFHADVRIRCAECNHPFVFYGLPVGIDLDSSSVSIDGTEAHLAIGPQGVVMPPLKGLRGFTVKTYV